MKTNLKSDKILFAAVNVIFTLIGVSMLFLTSMIWIGTKEDFQGRIRDSFWSFFGFRFLVCFLVSIVLIIVAIFLNLMIRKIRKNIEKKVMWSVVVIEFSVFVFLSLAFVVIWLL